MNNLKEVLSKCMRKTSWGLVEDPLAQDILNSPYLKDLEKSLDNLKLPYLEPLSAGVFHLVLSAGNNVVKIGFGQLQDILNIPEILQPIIRQQIGSLRYEIMPKANTVNVTQEDLDNIVSNLNEKGYHWGDSGIDNIGLINGKPFIIDADGIQKINVIISNTKKTIKIK